VKAIIPARYAEVVPNGGMRERQGPELPDDQNPVTWGWIKEQSLDALDALIAKRERTAKLVVVARNPLPLPPRKLLYVTPSVDAPRGDWRDCDFVVVDADTVELTDPPRHRVELAYEPKARRIVLNISPAVRRSLGTATHVRVMRYDDFDLDLMRQLRTCVDAATRAPRVVELWSPPKIVPTGTALELNAAQAQALSALTGTGGWLIWGPPGTGKTKVIVHAVKHALHTGRTVLIASNTHVAVDNVVKDLIGTVESPGNVIRVGGQDKVDRVVLEHPWLMVDKAAAAITNRDARLAAVDLAQKANKDDPSRQRLAVVVEQLETMDVLNLEEALRARAAEETVATLLTELAPLEAEADAQIEQIALVASTIENEQCAAGQLSALQHAEKAAAAAVSRANQQVSDTQERLAQWSIEHATAGAALSTIKDKKEKWYNTFQWRQQQLSEAAGKLAARCDNARQAVQALTDALPVLERSAHDKHQEHTNSRGRLTEAQAAAHRLPQLRERLQRLETIHCEASGPLEVKRSELADARAIAGSVENAGEVLQHAESSGTLALLAERETLIESITELDDRLRNLQQQRRKIEDEYTSTRKILLETAPVVACTLAALTTKTELANRRFDTVIIDEAESARIPDLMYAGSKADQCLAYVGDFLQNEPIVDTDDAVSPEAQRNLPWQESDVFALLGIRDRATAQANLRCIALQTQFRYPPIIADLVNDFCYDGLLHTAWSGTPVPQHITFVDTSSHQDQGLTGEDSSWWHPLGLTLLQAIYELTEPGETIGMVCPYKAHARRATAMTRANQLDIPCGTAHSFQGRQFDTVILDLMQDSGQLRWVAAADLSGGKREVFRAIQEMKRDGTPITFAAVAKVAKVSQWLVYADGVREYIEAARSAQAAEPAQAKRGGRSASEASLRTDLQLAKQDNRRLRGEVDRLKKALRERLGTQLEASSVESLKRRVDELLAANDRYRSENSRLAAELDDAHTQLRAAEEDLAASRTSLRRMIRESSSAPA
jgi:AAA domain/Family of unknown function (DUF6262)